MECVERERVRFDSSVINSIARVYVLGLAVLAVMFPAVSFASIDSPLTDLAYTAGFQGNWEIFSKFNFVGKFLSAIISIGCLLGLFLLMVRIIATILYLSNKSIFNRVHEIKSAGKGQKFFGMQQVGRDVWNGNLGTGFDAALGFVLSLAPDVIEYSDYADGGVTYNLTDTDTVTQWFLKTALSYIMMIFFLSAGFGGVLFQAFATVSDAMIVAAERFVNSNLEQYVDRALNTGSTYKFAYSATGTEFGKFQQKVAKRIYALAQKQCKSLTTSNLYTLGENIDGLVGGTITEDNLVAAAIGYNKNNPNDAANLEFDVIVNTNQSYLTGDSSSNLSSGYKNVKKDSSTATAGTLVEEKDSSGNVSAGTLSASKTYAIWDLSADNVGLTSIDGKDSDIASSKIYFHVVIRKTESADETYYFENIKTKQQSSQE